MSTIPFSEMTLDELRLALAPRIAANAVFDGWSDRALSDAAEGIGISPDRARLAFPGGEVEMIDTWFGSLDEGMAQRHSAANLARLKIRDRIETLILTRLELAQPQREAVRRALTKLAQPTNLARGTRLGWRSADLMWRLAGDTATDFNYYTKRVTLAAVYGSTLVTWLGDDSENYAETKAFLRRRIDGVMKFEKAKAKLKPDPERFFSFTRFAGRLRYPDR
jgi:ubiquinone biosynthesis protein COQ9